MNQIHLSIIIGNYNTYELTSSCLESIYKYKPNFSFEVIVVDDFSPDGSRSKLKALENKYKSLKVLLNTQNEGYVKTNNRGLSLSTGKYKLLLNSDTLVHRNSLQKLVEFAERTGDAGVVGCKLLNKDNTVQASCYNFPGFRNVINYSKFIPNPWSTKPSVIDAVVGAVFLITPKAYRLIGGLNEKYISYFEDLDYCRAVYKNKLKVYYLPDAVVTHYHGESFKQLSNSDNQWKKLIPSSITYHGYIKHYLLFMISWIYQKVQRLLNR